MGLVKMHKRKSQIWFTDFAIGLIIFSFALISYYVYTTNISKQDTLLMDDLVSDAKTVSLSLTSEGYWDGDNAIRLGFTDSYNKMDNDKFNEFMKINYNTTKKLLGTNYDYFLYFVNESNDVQNIEGYCGTGETEVVITYDVSAAYYYQAGSKSEDNFKTFMKTTFNAKVYCEAIGDCPGEAGDFDAFLNDINNYDFIVIEQPWWSGGGAGSQFGRFEAKADPWLLGGGILFVGGALPSANQVEAFGVEFNKLAGASKQFGLATVVNEDPFIAVKERENIIFTQEYHVIDVPPANADFVDIARFNGTYVDFDQIKVNGDIAIARWSYGDGRIFFFSDFEANYLAGDFQEILEGSAKKWANAACKPVNITNIPRDNLVKVERMIIHNSDLVKMVLYLWD